MRRDPMRAQIGRVKNAHGETFAVWSMQNSDVHRLVFQRVIEPRWIGHSDALAEVMLNGKTLAAVETNDPASCVGISLWARELMDTPESRDQIVAVVMGIVGSMNAALELTRLTAAHGRSQLGEMAARLERRRGNA